VLLWPDTFTSSFTPAIGQAAVEVLERAGWAVDIPTEPLCCGLTWISTGQLAVAKRVLARTVSALAPHVREGGLVVGLEPSCTAVFRSDAAELFPTDQDVHRLREHTVTLAELLTEHTDGWQPPRVGGEGRQVKALAQVHCHQHAVLGWDADQRLLEAAGVDVEHLESGCCGLAGNFGFTAGHGEVSEAIAEQVLMPRLRKEPRSTVTLADGFSCRTQVHELDSGGHEGVHLAELLASAYRDAPVDGLTLGARRPAVPSAAARASAVGAAGVAAVAGSYAASAAARRTVRRLVG
jgi:Fe-S oxidoreductase